MDAKRVPLQLICRTCLTTNNDMKNIFNIAYIINSCTSVQLEQNDGFPATICSDCMALAKKAYGFRLLCEHSDTVLRGALCTNITPSIKVEKFDLNLAEEHTEAEYSSVHKTEVLQTNDSLSEINNINETTSYEIEEIFGVHKTEILETDGNKDFQGYNNETLIRNHSLCNTTQAQNTATEPPSVTNNVNEKESSICDNEDDEISGDLCNDEKVENKSKSIFPCRFCGQKYLLKRNLKFHEENHTEGFKCDLCSKGFHNKEKFRKHINMHKQKGAYPCPTCGKKFTLPCNLSVHQRIHTGVKPYSCKFCDKSFTQWSDRRSHEFTHTQEKSYLCSICGSTFARSFSLLNHTRRVHFNPSEDKLHVCTVCDREFKVRRDLTNHMNCHSEIRNFVCKVCNKTFKHKANLGLHKKIHAGIKPHVCPVCQRAFLQKHVLTSHLRTHTP